MKASAAVVTAQDAETFQAAHAILQTGNTPFSFDQFFGNHLVTARHGLTLYERVLPQLFISLVVWIGFMCLVEIISCLLKLALQVKHRRNRSQPLWIEEVAIRALP